MKATLQDAVVLDPMSSTPDLHALFVESLVCRTNRFPQALSWHVVLEVGAFDRCDFPRRTKDQVGMPSTVLRFNFTRTKGGRASPLRTTKAHKKDGVIQQRERGREHITAKSRKHLLSKKSCGISSTYLSFLAST